MTTSSCTCSQVYARAGYDVGVNEERYCSNCRAEIPKGVVVCPVCGVYAGDVFDGKLPRRKRSYGWVVVLLAIGIVAAGAVYFLKSPTPDRVSRAPGPILSKKLAGAAGAMQAIRKRLVSDQIPNECLVLMSNGERGGEYVVRAFDRCQHKQLGEWKVDAKTHEVSR